MLFRSDISSLLVQAVNLAIIIFVLRKFVFIPYLAHIDNETAKRADLESKTREADTLVKAAVSEADALVAAAKNEATDIRKNARDLAKRESALTLSAASVEAQGIKNKALSDINTERNTLETEMRSKILSVAIRLNEKLLGDSAKNSELLSKFARDNA